MIDEGLSALLTSAVPSTGLRPNCSRDICACVTLSGLGTTIVFFLSASRICKSCVVDDDDKFLRKMLLAFFMHLTDKLLHAAKKRSAAPNAPNATSAATEQSSVGQAPGGTLQGGKAPGQPQPAKEEYSALRTASEKVASFASSCKRLFHELDTCEGIGVAFNFLSQRTSNSVSLFILQELQAAFTDTKLASKALMYSSKDPLFRFNFCFIFTTHVLK